MLITEDVQQQKRVLITGTDASAIVGMNKWQSPIDIWLNKRHPETVQVPSASKQNLMHWGSRLEQAIADEYADQTGSTLFKPVPTLIVHPRIKWLAGSPDFLVKGKKIGLEVKRVSSWVKDEWGPSGTDLIPHQYLIQVQHYLMLLGWKEFHVSALIGDADFRMFVVFADIELQKMIFDAEKNFYQRFIVGNEEPKLKADGDQVIRYIERKWSKASKRVIEVAPYDKDTKEILLRLRKARKAASEANKEKKDATTAAKLIMQDAVCMQWPDEEMTINWKNSPDKQVIDWESIAQETLKNFNEEDRLALIKKYISPVPGKRRFTVTDGNADDEED